MAIPGYEEIVVPLLQTLADGHELAASEVRHTVVEQFQLSKDELKQLEPSGHTPLFVNRFHWARLYLDKSGLNQYPRRGVSHIAERGPVGDDVVHLVLNPGS